MSLQEKDLLQLLLIKIQIHCLKVKCTFLPDFRTFRPVRVRFCLFSVRFKPRGTTFGYNIDPHSPPIPPVPGTICCSCFIYTISLLQSDPQPPSPALLLPHSAAERSRSSPFTTCIVGAWLEINAVLNQCNNGVDFLLQHEISLLDSGIIRVDSPANWSLFEMEQTLLTLGSVKDLTSGVFYCLAIPTDEGLVAAR